MLASRRDAPKGRLSHYLYVKLHYMAVTQKTRDRGMNDTLWVLRVFTTNKQ